MTRTRSLRSARLSTSIVVALSSLASLAVAVPTVAAETRVTGATDPSVPLEIEPLSDPLVDDNSPLVMWIQKLPATRTVSRITVGDIGSDPQRCASDGPWDLLLSEAMNGQLFFGDGGRQVRSLATKTITRDLRRMTWTIPPTTLFAGRGYWVELQPQGTCRDLVRRTWAHDGTQVNSGPHGCVYNSYVKENGRPYRMWHVAGQEDADSRCVFGGRPDNEPIFDPAMPGGWLTTISYNGNDRYVARRWTGPSPTSPCADTNLANMGLEESLWRTGPSNLGDELVCRWTQFAPPGQEVPSGWYYALYWTKARNGAPRDMYLKLDYNAADIAHLFRPNLYFDSSEEWRPLNIDGFFAETDHRLCGSFGCVNVSRPDDLAQFPGARHLDIAGDGDGSNYKSPFPECNVGLRECDSGPRSAAYFREVRGSGEYRYLDYWFFYRFNDAPIVGEEFLSPGEDLRHEGDWEGVTIGVSAGDAKSFDFASSRSTVIGTATSATPCAATAAVPGRVGPSPTRKASACRSLSRIGVMRTTRGRAARQRHRLSGVKSTVAKMARASPKGAGTTAAVRGRITARKIPCCRFALQAMVTSGSTGGAGGAPRGRMARGLRAVRRRSSRTGGRRVTMTAPAATQPARELAHPHAQPLTTRRMDVAIGSATTWPRCSAISHGFKPRWSADASDNEGG